MNNLRCMLVAMAVMDMAGASAALDVPSRVVASTNRTDGIALSWDKVAGATGYTVYRYGAMSSQTGIFTQDVTSNGFFDATAPVMQYAPYRVRAKGPDGSLSDYSAYVRGWRNALLRTKPGETTYVVPSAEATSGHAVAVECNYLWGATTTNDWIQLHARAFGAVNGYTNVYFDVSANRTGAPRVGEIVSSVLGVSVTNRVIQGSAFGRATNAVEAIDDPRIAPVEFAEGAIAENAAFVPVERWLAKGGACLQTSPMKRGERACLKWNPKRSCIFSFDWWKNGSSSTLVLLEGDDPATARTLANCTSMDRGTTSSVSLAGERKPIWIVFTCNEDGDAAFLDNFGHQYPPLSVRVDGLPAYTFEGRTNPIGSGEWLPCRTIVRYYDGSEDEVDMTLTCGYLPGWRRESGRIYFNPVSEPTSATLSGTWTECLQTRSCSKSLRILPPLGTALDNTWLSFASDATWLWSNTGSIAASGKNGTVASAVPPADGGVSSLRTTVSGPTLLSFKWAVKTESNHDWLRLMVDGQQVEAITGDVPGFRQMNVRILGEGDHDVRWEWVKDASSTVVNEGAWLDDVQATTIPDMPQDLRLSTYELPNNQICLTWDPIVHGDGYNVYCQFPGSGEWTLIDSIDDISNPLYIQTFNPTVDGRDYRFRVTAFSAPDDLDDAGELESDPSNDVGLTVADALELEDSFFVVGAAGGGFDASVLSTYDFWTASTDDDWILLDTDLCELDRQEENYSNELYFDVAANATGAPRIGRVVVRAKDGAATRTITVLQSSGAGTCETFEVVGPSSVNARDFADYSVRLVVDGAEFTDVVDVDWDAYAEGGMAPFFIHDYDNGSDGRAGRFFSDDVEKKVWGIVAATISVNGLRTQATTRVQVFPRPSAFAPEGVTFDLDDLYSWYVDQYEGVKALRSAELPPFSQSTLAAEVAGPGILRFDWRLPCTGYSARLGVVVDGVEMATCPPAGAAFTEQALVIEGGEHRVEWTYRQQQPNWGADALGLLRNLRFDSAVDTGAVMLRVPEKILPGGESVKCSLDRIFALENGGEMGVPYAITNEAAWRVEYGDVRTAARVTSTITAAGTLELLAPSSVDWEDVATVTCTAEIDGEVGEFTREVPILPIPLNEVLDCGNLTFRADTNWKITRGDASAGDLSLAVDGDQWGTSSVRTSVLGAGTLTFDWRAVLRGGNYAASIGAYALRLQVDGVTVWEDSDEYDGRAEWTTVSVDVSGNSYHTIVWEFSGWYQHDNVERMFLDNVTWTFDANETPPQVTGLRIEGPIDVTGRESGSYDCYLQYAVQEDGEPVEYEVLYAPDAWEFIPLYGDAATDWSNNIYGDSLSVISTTGEAENYGAFKIRARVVFDGVPIEDEFETSYRPFTTAEKAALDNVRLFQNVSFSQYGWYGSMTDMWVGGGSSARTIEEEGDDADAALSLTVFGHGTVSGYCRTSSAAGDELKVIVDDDWDHPHMVVSGTCSWREVKIVIPEPASGMPEREHSVVFRFTGNHDGVTAGENCAWVDYLSWNGTVLPPIDEARIYCPSVLTNSMSMALGVNFYRAGVGEDEEVKFNQPPATGDEVPQVVFSYDVPEQLRDQVAFTPGPEQNQVTVTVAPNITAGGVVGVTARYALNGEDCEDHREIEVVKRVPRRQALDNDRLVYEVKAPSVSPVEDVGEVWGRWENMFMGANLPAEWFGAWCEGAEGNHAARAGGIAQGESTVLRTELLGPGTLTFNWKTRCVVYGCRLVFTVNGESVEDNELDGETDWETKIYELTGERNVVAWTFVRDGWWGADDCAWVDNVRWTGAVQAIPDGYIDVDAVVEEDVSSLAPEGVRFAPVGDHPWYYGCYRAENVLHSAPLESAGESAFAAEVSGPGLLCFDWMLPCEDGAARLVVKLDGVEQAVCAGSCTNYVRQSVLVGGGSHRVEWVYSQTGPVDDDEAFGLLRNLHWYLDTGDMHLVGPVDALWGGAAVEYAFCGIFEDADGEQVDVPYVVDDDAAWRVVFGDNRTAELIEPEITVDGTLRFSVPETVVWRDVATIACSAEVDGVVQERTAEVQIRSATLNEVLDCDSLIFGLRNELDATIQHDDAAWWRVTTDDASMGGMALGIGGYYFSYGFQTWLSPTVTATALGTGTLTFDCRIELEDGCSMPETPVLRLWVDGREVWLDVLCQNRGDWSTQTIRISDSSRMDHEICWYYYGMTGEQIRRVYLDHVTWTPDEPETAPRVTGIRIDGSADLTGFDSTSYVCYLQYLANEGGEWIEGEIPIRPDAWSFTPLSGEAASDWDVDLDSDDSVIDVDKVGEDVDESGSFSIGAHLDFGGRTFADEIVVEYPRSTSMRKAVLDAGPLGDNASIGYFDGWFGTFDEAHVGASSARSRPGDGDSISTSFLNMRVFGHGTVTLDCRTSSAPGDELSVVFDGDYDHPVAVLSGETEWRTLTIDIPAPAPGEEEEEHVIEIRYEDNGDGVTEGENCAWIDNITWNGTAQMELSDWSVHYPQALTNGMSEVVGVDFHRRRLDYEDIGGQRPAAGDDVPEVSFSYDVPPQLTGKVTFTPGPGVNEVTAHVASDVAVGGQVGVTMSFTFNGDEYTERRDFDVMKFVPRRRALDNDHVTYEVEAPAPADSDDEGAPRQAWEDNVTGWKPPAEWFGLWHQGALNDSCVRSGKIGDNQSTTLRATLLGPGQITFDWKSSTETGYDVVVFRVNGVELASLSGDEGEWATETFDLSDATNVVEWCYSKDSSGYDGLDCVWVDNVRWTGSYLPIPDGYVDPDAVEDAGPAADETSRGVPYSWLESYAVDPGADRWETTENRLAANGRNSLVECYVAGLDPTDSADEFMTFISLTNGVPYISWSPDLGAERTYIVKGKVRLDDPAWVAPTNSTHRFFKVEIEWGK